MRRPLHCLIAALVLGTAVAASGTFAIACSCVPSPPPKEAAAQAAAVFTGKVVSIEEAGEFELRITLEVARHWKGVKGKQVTLYSATDSAACGFGFEKGASYLVYAHESKRGGEKVLQTNICTRTAAVKNADEDLKALGDGKPAE